jgi:hypothetical protein
MLDQSLLRRTLFAQEKKAQIVEPNCKKVKSLIHCLSLEFATSMENLSEQCIEHEMKQDLMQK